MKKLVLGFFTLVFFVLSPMQAEWKEFTYKNKFENIRSVAVGGPQDIWVVASTKKSGGNFKWDEAKGEFEKQDVPVKHSPAQSQEEYAFKGGLAVLFPTWLDEKAEAFTRQVAEKIYLFVEQELKKLVIAKKLSQEGVDKFIPTKDKEMALQLIMMDASIMIGEFVRKAYQEASPKKETMDVFTKLSEIAEKKQQDLMKGFVLGYSRLLKLLVDGKSETIRDFKDLKVLVVKAVAEDDIWVVTRKVDFGRKKNTPDYFIEHWNGKEWKKMGEANVYSNKIRIGNDGSVFVKQIGKGLQKWKGSSLKDTLIDFEKEGTADFSVINANDIWLSHEVRQEKGFLTTFFHWDGKDVEQRESLKNVEYAVASAPGIALIRGYDVHGKLTKIYRWVDEEKKPKRILPKVNGRTVIRSLDFVSSSPIQEAINQIKKKISL